MNFDHPVLSSLLPVVLLIGVGFVAGRARLVRPESVRDLSNLVFLVLTQALLFRTMSSVHLERLDMRPVFQYFLVAAVLFAGSFIRNPSLPGVPSALAAQTPSGVFKATRHPMMWGFALWGVGHILVAPRIDNFIFAGSLIFLALVGSKAQEIKKRSLMGGQWAQWLSRTHFVVRPAALLRAGIGPWVAGILIWTIATWAHPYWGVGGAGLFRWFGG